MIQIPKFENHKKVKQEESCFLFLSLELPSSLSEATISITLIYSESAVVNQEQGSLRQTSSRHCFIAVVPAGCDR